MPGNIGFVACIFGKKLGTPAKEMRAYQVLDSVKNSRMPDDLIGPRKNQMGFLVVSACNFSVQIDAIAKVLQFQIEGLNFTLI